MIFCGEAGLGKPGHYDRNFALHDIMPVESRIAAILQMNDTVLSRTRFKSIIIYICGRINPFSKMA